MPEIIEGEATLIDDGRSFQHSILPSWTEPLPAAYKTKRAVLALGIGMTISCCLGFLMIKYYGYHQDMHWAIKLAAMLGLFVPMGIGIYRWKFWINHPDVRKYAMVAEQTDNGKSVNKTRIWGNSSKSNLRAAMTPEALADYEFYTMQSEIELQQIRHLRREKIVNIIRSPTVRYPIAAGLFWLAYFWRHHHLMGIAPIVAVALLAMLAVYELAFWIMISAFMIAVLSFYISRAILLPVSIAIIICVVIIGTAIKKS